MENTKLSHVAIIMDGNRRFAKSKGMPGAMGHKMGVEALKKTVKAAHKFGIKYLTVYAFSSENNNRSKEEVDFLMSLLANTIKNELNELSKNDVCLNFIGNLLSLNKNLYDILEKATEKTAQNKGLRLQIAINYGAQNEILNAVNQIIKSKVKSVSKSDFESFLYTKNIPNPDLLIRTGGEMRISNFLLWQIAYSEIYVTDTFWPDFDENALSKAIIEFGKRQRRYGK
ncbi:MAG: di-trans,poly-cis-decaprenylcistransferase [Candidatus Gastranaerophilales bacterium]|nr:di-trans,poly-cis-decaprenylcistransferase [Candidatus Gastranaerophilales bacterium]